MTNYDTNSESLDPGGEKTLAMNKYRLAKLYDANNDLSNQWFVYFYYKHPESGKFIRFRKVISNRILTKSGRRDKAHNLIKELNLKLKQGWNPYAQLIYD